MLRPTLLRGMVVIMATLDMDMDMADDGVDTMAMDTDMDGMAARNVMPRLTPLSSLQHLPSQHLKFMPTPMPMDMRTIFH